MTLPINAKNPATGINIVMIDMPTIDIADK
jgi:hypothetical protein